MAETESITIIPTAKGPSEDIEGWLHNFCSCVDGLRKQALSLQGDGIPDCLSPLRRRLGDVELALLDLAEASNEAAALIRAARGKTR